MTCHGASAGSAYVIWAGVHAMRPERGRGVNKEVLCRIKKTSETLKVSDVFFLRGTSQGFLLHTH